MGRRKKKIIVSSLMTRKELLDIAKELKIPYCYRMKKEELIEAINSYDEKKKKEKKTKRKIVTRKKTVEKKSIKKEGKKEKEYTEEVKESQSHSYEERRDLSPVMMRITKRFYNRYYEPAIEFRRRIIVIPVNPNLIFIYWHNGWGDCRIVVETDRGETIFDKDVFYSGNYYLYHNIKKGRVRGKIIQNNETVFITPWIVLPHAQEAPPDKKVVWVTFKVKKIGVSWKKEMKFYSRSPFKQFEGGSPLFEGSSRGKR